MKRIFAIIQIVLLAGCLAPLNAQLKTGNKLFDELKYNQAIPYYEKVIEAKKDKGKKQATEKLAECYRLTKMTEEAAIWYKKATNQKGISPNLFFQYGNVLRTLGKYSEAADNYKKYLKINSADERAERYLEYCKQITDWKNLENSVDWKNDSIINSRYSEFCPIHYNGGIVFTSDRNVDLVDNNNYSWTGNGYLDLYYHAKILKNGQEEKTIGPDKMSKVFNQPYHDGPACFSNENSIIYTTRTLKNKRKRKDVIQTNFNGIYIASLITKKVEYTPFPYNNNFYSVAHPAVTEDGQLLIFSSDKPKGNGESDLYFCKLVDGEWSTPENMGNVINSFGNEYFPYFENDTTLYFASDGHMGYGGLDIFVTYYKNGKWQKPINLKAPINSSYDDFGISFKKDKNYGFFSSNRPDGEGADDIYTFWNFKLIPDPKKN